MSAASGQREGSLSEAALAAGIVACAFFYFLLFAQFAFLKRIEELDAQKVWLQPVMFLMGAGGVIGSVCAWLRFRIARLRGSLFFGFLAVSLLAVASQLVEELPVFLAIGFAVGLSLGWLTVSIVPLLRLSLAPGDLGRWCGLGVGLAYFFSNVPVLFLAKPEDQCLWAALAGGLGAGLSLALRGDWRKERLEPSTEDRADASWYGGVGFWLAIGLFSLLVWLDSAAFYVIQESDTFRSGTWGGSLQLWTIAFAHLAAALFSGWRLGRGGLVGMLALALALLVSGSWLLVEFGGSLAMAAALLYVCGVSIYSTALVAFGALGGTRSSAWSIAKRAGLLFAIAGWMASGFGIGMARDLKTVPPAFLIVSTLAGGGLAFLLSRASSRGKALG